MRFISLLLPQNPENGVKYSTTKNEPHIYNKNLYDNCMFFTYLIIGDQELQKKYREIVCLSHPFEYITTYITTSFIPNCKPLKATNAFMKMWEFLKWITNKDNHTNKSILDIKEDFNMFDVAGAPGMFVIAADNFLKEYYPNVNLNWKSCSLVGGTAFTDIYELYKNNPNRFTPCDVSNESDIKKCIEWAKEKYTLVTGDIGAYHEDDYETLQEEKQLDIEWGQMVLALNLCKVGGILFLKMYSLVTKETIYLLDTLTDNFEHVYITKFYTTRIFNNESYIICVNRLDKDVSQIPLKRPYINDYVSDNMALVASFEYSRHNIRLRYINLLQKIIKSYPNIKFNNIKSNPAYKLYFEEFEDLYNEMLWFKKSKNNDFKRLSKYNNNTLNSKNKTLYLIDDTSDDDETNNEENNENK